MPALKRLERTEASLPEPAVKRESEHDLVLGYGKPFDWTTRPYSSGTVPESELQKLPPSLFVPKIALDYGFGKFLYAPIPSTFNAHMCSESELMGKRVELRSDLYHTNVWLLRGAYADGTILNKGSAFALFVAGCSVIKVRGKGPQLGVAHAGRDCLIDRQMLEGGKPRRRESIVMSLVEAMLAITPSVRDLDVEILFSINPEHFPHPWSHQKFGEFNKQMTEYVARRWGRECILGYDDPKEREQGRIVQDAVIRNQFISLGVLPEKITTVPAPEREQWFDTREKNGDSLARNAVFIKNF